MAQLVRCGVAAKLFIFILTIWKNCFARQLQQAIFFFMLMHISGGASEREWSAFERGLILGLALRYGQWLSVIQVAQMLGYSYNGAWSALARCRVLDKNDEGQWGLSQELVKDEKQG